MSCWKGDTLNLSIFGQSHGPSIGMNLSGIPAGYPVNIDELQAFLNRRAPGSSPYVTTRKEPDTPDFLSGLKDNLTSGDQICAVIYNKNIRSSDYQNIADCPRPGHADYTAKVKYGMDYDVSGGGQFSGRLTAPICIAGGLCIQWLKAEGIEIIGHISAIGSVEDLPKNLNGIDPQQTALDPHLPVIDHNRGKEMLEQIAKAKAAGDSVGGIIECVVTGLPAGLGGPLFDGIEGKLSQILFGIPAVKAVEFGSGFSSAALPGSINNDAFTVKDGKIITLTNNCGGILGGITNGMPLTLRLAVKATPSIAQKQNTVNLKTMENTTIEVQGRHDPCIVIRAVPVVEAAVAIVLLDEILSARQNTSKNIKSLRAKIDQIDSGLVKLFAERMEIAKNIGYYKLESGLPIYDPVREKEKLQTILEYTGQDMRDYIRDLYETVFRVSKDYQIKCNDERENEL